MRALITLLVSLLLGCATTAILAFSALLSADRSTGGSSSILIRNDTELWLVRTHTALGLIWINCELFWPPLVNPQPTLNDLPHWATPPERAWPETGLVRVATLGVGWPAPFMYRQWITTRSSDLFPLPHEYDDGRDSLRRASVRFREADAAAPLNFLWRGLLINVGFFSLAAGAVLWAGMHLAALLAHRKERKDSSNQQQQ